MGRIGKTTLTNFLMRLPVIILTFFYSIFLIKLLGPEGNGLFSYINASIGFCIIVFGFNVKQSALFHVANEKFVTSKVFGYAVAMHLFTILIVTIFTILGFIFPSPLSYFIVPKSFFSVFYILFFLASFVMQFLTELLKTILIASRKFMENNKILLISSLFQTIVYAGGFLIVHLGEVDISRVKLFSLVLTVQLLLSVLTYYIFSINYGQGIDFHNRDLRKPFIKYASIDYFSQIGQFLNKRLDIWFVEFYVGLKNLGIYALASQFTNFLLEGVTPIQEVLKPNLINTERSKGNEQFVSIFKAVFCFIGLASLTLMILSTPLISILFGEEFLGAALPLRILSIGVVFIALKRVLISYNRAYNELKFNAYSQWLGVAVTIIFDILLIPKYGILGAAIASTLSYFSSFLFVFFIHIMRQKTKIADLFIPTRVEVKLLLGYFESIFAASKEE